MKTKNLFWISFLGALLFLFAQAVYAQETAVKTKTKTVGTNIKAKSEVSGERVESLSGISLFPDRRNGTFNLRFSEALKDSASMELKNQHGDVLYALNLAPEQAPMAKPASVGKLSSGLYLIEVRSANTVYWKKVRVRN